MIVEGRGYRQVAAGLRHRFVTDRAARTLRRTARLRKIGPAWAPGRAPAPAANNAMADALRRAGFDVGGKDKKR